MRARWPRILATLALAAAGACPAVEIGAWVPAWSDVSLLQARREGGVDSALLAFGTMGAGCTWSPQFDRRLAEAREFVVQRGRLALSLGGPDGPHPELVCTPEQLLALLQATLERTGARRVDWWLEGLPMVQQEAIDRRAQVLSALQARYADLGVSFTLRAGLEGVHPDGVRGLRTAIQRGVRIQRVNVVAMNFGSRLLQPMVPPTVSQAAIRAFQASVRQLAAVFPGLDGAGLHDRLGLTVMVGVNDDDTVFTLRDAAVLARFARDHGIGLLAYWGLQRDRPTATAALLPAGAAPPARHAFHRAFREGAGGRACAYPAWTAGQPYEPGDIVSHPGGLFRAIQPNPGYDPIVSTWFWSRHPCPDGPQPG